MSEEYFDIVDDLDQVVGRETRSAAHTTGLQHRGAHVFLFSEDGRMLVQKRSADRVQSPSLLDCSVSEHVKAGESYQNAAARGLLEELGLSEVELSFMVKFRMNYGINDNEISTLYQGRVDPNKVNFDHVEIAEISYLTIDEVKRLLTHEPEKLCSWFAEILNWHFGMQAKLIVMNGR